MIILKLLPILFILIFVIVLLAIAYKAMASVAEINPKPEDVNLDNISDDIKKEFERGQKRKKAVKIIKSMNLKEDKKNKKILDEFSNNQ